MQIQTLDEITRVYVRARLTAEMATKNLEEVTGLLKEAMQAERTAKVRIEVGERVYRVNYRQRVNFGFDADLVRSRVPSELWAKITRSTVSKPAVEKAINDGELDAREVGSWVTPKDPVTWIEMKESDDEEGGDGSDQEV